MELKEILEGVPGLTRRFIYYLEARGFISPAKVHKRRIARRDYTEQDLKTVQEVWSYYQRGYSLQAAHELATRTERAVAYITLSVGTREWAQALESLKGHPQIVEASAVYASDFDFIVKADTPDESEIYHTLFPMLAEKGIRGCSDVYMARERFHNKGVPTGDMEHEGMRAYILMKVPGKNVEEVMERLKGLEGIEEASTIYGESDIIARVQVKGQEELDRLVMTQVHGIPAVESTRTFIVVSRLHWSR